MAILVLFLKKSYLFLLYGYKLFTCMYICVSHMYSSQSSLKIVLNPLELES